MKLSYSDAGRRYILTINHGGRKVILEGIIAQGNTPGRIALLHSNRNFSDGTSLPDMQGYPYVWHQYMNMDAQHVQGFIDFKLLGVITLYKKDIKGSIFRRVYKQDGDLIFLGSIQKDPEECKNPSTVIQIMDLNYLKNKGWDFYKEELSAEKQAQLSVKEK